MKGIFAALSLLAAACLACGLAGRPTPAQPSSTPPLAPTAVQPTITQVVPSPLPTRFSTATAAPVPTRAPAATQPPAPAGNITLQFYLIALDDNGASGKKIGCSDSVIPVTFQAPRTQAVLREALNRLLSMDERDYGQSGLYNALYQSDLVIDSLAVQNGDAYIRLSGKLTSGGVCDDPRIIAQIEETALQFSTVQRVFITVNGTPIQELLSGR